MSTNTVDDPRKVTTHRLIEMKQQGKKIFANDHQQEIDIQRNPVQTTGADGAVSGHTGRPKQKHQACGKEDQTNDQQAPVFI